MDTELIRARLHRAVDDLVDELALRGRSEPEWMLEAAGPCEPFEYRRPDGVWEEFDPALQFRVNGSAEPRDVVVAFTEREAWGARRRRAIVFDATGLPHAPDRWYPWAEFVGTDDGGLAAPIPNPARPRSYLKDGDALPERLAGARVERLDRLIASVADGRSLRLVVGEDEALAMARHGHWVASLRGRV